MLLSKSQKEKKKKKSRRKSEDVPRMIGPGLPPTGGTPGGGESKGEGKTSNLELLLDNTVGS